MTQYITFSTTEMNLNVTTNSTNILGSLTEIPDDHQSHSSRGVRGEQPTWYFIIQGIISLITVSDNGLVIFLILTRRNLQITCNWFVLSLSVVDFFVGLLFPSISLICQLNDVSCNYSVFYSAFSTILAISIANTCMMTFDRLTLGLSMQ